MVCLNENISFNVKSLKNSLTFEMQNFIEGYEHIIKDNNKFIFLKNQIKKKIDSLFNFDNFIYVNMNPNLCTFKHKRGKNEGYFCCKQIRTNIIDSKKDFLCCKHSKNHIPKKRKEKKKQLNKDESLYFNVENQEQEKLLQKENTPKYNSFSVIKEIKKVDNNFLNNKINIKKINVYKDLLLNDEYKYETLFKDFSLLDFCINKFKKTKKCKKNYLYNNYIYNVF